MRLSKNNWFYFLLAGLALVGIWMTWTNTPWGVRVGFDSYFYLSAAQNVIKGLGLSRLSPEGQIIPLTHYPPLYPLAVAGFSLLVKGDILLSARWTAALIFGINILLFGYLCFRYTKSTVAGFLGSCFCLLSPILMSVTISAFSEGLFILFLLLSWFLIAESLTRLEWRLLLAAACITACSSLTRYLGITLILAGSIGILVLSLQPLKKKLKAASLFVGVSSLPLGLWYLRNWLVSGSTSNRTFAIHWPDRENFIQALNTMTAWILPDSLSIRIRLVVWVLVFLSIMMIAILWVRQLRPNNNGLLNHPTMRFALLLVFYGIAYLFALATAHTFFDSSTRWETRILSPLYIASALLGMVVVWNGAQLERYRWRTIPWVAALLLLFGGYLPMSVEFLNKSRNEGEGFTSPTWKNSPTMQAISSFHADSTIYTNNATAIYFVLGRVVYGIPERFDSVKAQPRPDYAANLARMRQQLQQPHSALVIFSPYRNVPEYPPLEELTDGLVVFDKTLDGTIYVYPGQNP